MLTRVAILGSASKEARQAAADKDLILCPVANGDALPAGVAGMLAPRTRMDEAVEKLAAIGGEQERTLLLLAEAIDAREGLPANAGKRLLEHATRFAAALSLSKEDTSILQRGAILHDIGKLRVSNEVLLKKSVLDYDEWVSLQRHTVYGADLLKESRLHDDICDIVKYHHECYDGTGYPEALERDDIPMLAHVTKIIDVYCAMTSPRLYRKNVHTHESVLEHLRSERGKHFDPRLLDIFIEAKVGRAAL